MLRFVICMFVISAFGFLLLARLVISCISQNDFYNVPLNKVTFSSLVLI